MPKVFLSHSTLDKELASEIRNQIQEEIPDAKVFVSSRPDGIPSGKKWFEHIVNELNLADILIPLITPHSDKSMWVAFEYGYFWRRTNGQAIFPLIHPKAQIPSPLNEIQGKLVTEVSQLEVHFSDICDRLQRKYEKRAQLNLIVDAALKLSALTPDERKKQAECRRDLKGVESRVVKQAILEYMKTLDILHDAALQWIGDLQGVEFVSANMQRIDLGGNNLQGANFWAAHLEGAKLGSTQLQGADFNHAHLEGASFQEAKLDGTATLPDGTKYKPELGLEQMKSYGAVIDR